MDPTLHPDNAKRLFARRAAELEADARATRLRRQRGALPRPAR